MFELERLKLEQENLEDMIERTKFENKMNNLEHKRAMKYYEMDWQENVIAINKLVKLLPDNEYQKIS
jgi:hypothetical protein